MNGFNILFYSQYCETCKNLIILLKNENLLGYFKLICVDDKLDKLPPQITAVPTMIVTTINKPLVCEETFKWIEQIKFLRQQQVMDINKKIIQNNIINNMNNVKKGPIGYDDEIMSGLSDKFAFTKEDAPPLPHAYFGVGDEERNAIFTAPEKNRELSRDLHSKLITDLKKSRSQQDNEYADYVKQQQINAVINAEKENLMQQQQNYRRNN